MGIFHLWICLGTLEEKARPVSFEKLPQAKGHAWMPLVGNWRAGDDGMRNEGGWKKGRSIQGQNSASEPRQPAACLGLPTPRICWACSRVGGTCTPLPQEPLPLRSHGGIPRKHAGPFLQPTCKIHSFSKILDQLILSSQRWPHQCRNHLYLEKK